MPCCSGKPLRITYKKCRPSGKKLGHRCDPSCSEPSSLVTSETVPPLDATLKIPVFPLANRIVPSLPQDAPRGIPALASTCTGPPPAGIFLIFPSAKNPIQWPSGDQKGFEADSVPDSGRRITSSSDRSQSVVRPS